MGTEADGNFARDLAGACPAGELPNEAIGRSEVLY